jgi:hypothetical protein
MGRIAETIEGIYNSEVSMSDKIIRLIEYGRKCGMNSHNFEIMLDEVKKYKWGREEENGSGHLRG